MIEAASFDFVILISFKRQSVLTTPPSKISCRRRYTYYYIQTSKMIVAPTLPNINRPQMQEMTELSSWLDDIFTGDTSSSTSDACNDTSSSLNMNATQSLPDTPVLPIHTNSDDFLTQESDWMDKENEAIISSPATSDAEHMIRPVSPSVSPYSAKSTIQIPEPMPSASSIDQQASSPIRRKTLPREDSLVSDGSDNEDTTARPTKRARSSTVSSVVNGPDEVVSAFVPKLDSKSMVVQKPVAQKPKSTDVVRKKTIRREKNREHAKKSRSKKRGFNVALEESVVALREENKKLRRLVYASFGERKAKAMVKERIRTPEDKMVEALKKPSNKVVSKSVVHYLESLRCDIKLHARK